MVPNHAPLTLQVQSNGGRNKDWRVKLGTQRQGDFTDNSINNDKDLANLLN